MTPAKVRFALVGAGGIAQSYAQAFRDHPDAELVAVADVRLDAAHALAGKLPGCRAADTYQELLDGPPFDAAIVSTPPDTHETIATYFLANGVHVLCEKPFTIGVASARRMVGVARRAGRVLTMASKFRYVADVTRAKAFVEDGLIGEVGLFENAFTSRVDMAGRWNSDPAVSGGGVLIDNGAHSLDLARYFLGPLAEVHAVEGKRFQPLPVEDTVQVFARSACGVLGTIDLSWSINKELESFIQIHGRLGTIRLGWKESKYKLVGSAGWVVFGSGYDKLQAFRANVGNFARHLRDGEALVIDPQDAVANVAAIDAGYRSLGRPEWSRLQEEVLV
jgi:predicted dehydrogenase